MGETRTEANHRWVRSGDVRLSVSDWGDPARPTVVLLHGYPDSGGVWSEVAAQLADTFHVVVYDVRGCGRSSAPEPLRGGFTLEKLTEDFRAVIDAVSPDRPVHLVGHDWGSVQGWEFATVERTEGRLASFTSISGPSLDHFGHWIKRRSSRPTPRRLAQLLGQGARSWYVYALHTPRLPELAWRGPLGRRWPALLKRLEKLPARPADRPSYPGPSLSRDAAHGAWLYRDNIRPRLLRPRPNAYARVPVQLVVPTGDAFLSERLYDDVEQWAPALVRRTVPAKHWLPRTRPDLLSRWVRDFVTAAEEGAAARAPEAGNRYRERFADQLVLVTGAASGIGRATVFAFAKAGARVVAVDRDAEGVARTAERARLLGAAEAWHEQVDVSDAPAMEGLATKVSETYGELDVLVNNAGIGLAGPFLETTVEDWRAVLDVNLWGVIHGCRLFGRRMADRGQGGHIVNVASAAAYQPSRLLSAYSTSKAAVLTLGESLRAELAGRDVGVSTVCPGLVRTPITSTARFAGVPAARQGKLRGQVSELYKRRNYPPERVADAILRAVLENSAVVPVSPEAHALRLLSRFTPGISRAMARVAPPLR